MSDEPTRKSLAHVSVYKARPISCRSVSHDPFANLPRLRQKLIKSTQCEAAKLSGFRITCLRCIASPLYTTQMVASSVSKHKISNSHQLANWLAEEHLRLALSTLQAGMLFPRGLRADGCLSQFERTFGRCLEVLGSNPPLVTCSLAILNSLSTRAKHVNASVITEEHHNLEFKAIPNRKCNSFVSWLAYSSHSQERFTMPSDLPQSRKAPV
jgi:hypothetical protein